MAKLILIKSLVFLHFIFHSLVFAQTEQYVFMSAVIEKINDKFYLALILDNEKDWHTYWKNPGDAGLTIEFEFFLNQEKKQFKELEWPVPTKYIEEGDILAYGYSDQNIFFYEMDSPHPDTTLLIKGKWLVCKDICLPGEDQVVLNLNHDGLAKSENYQLKKQDIINAFNKLPLKTRLPEELEISLTKGAENELLLQYSLKNIDLNDFNFKSNILFPYLQDPFDFKHEKLFFDEKSNTLYGLMPIMWDGEYEEPQWPLPENGIFEKPIMASFLFAPFKDQRAIRFDYTFNDFSLGGHQAYQEFLKSLKPIEYNKPLTKSQHVQKDYNILLIILFAFLGGLILNLMPCVLPVISLKLFGLISHQEQSKQKVLKHNLSYTLGVIISFMILALIIVFLKMSGEKIGWGFQLQSAGFVLFMMIIIFVMALNMFGLFEFITPGGKKLGNTQLKEGFSADFFNGVLATILSTPCSAPFLGAALTFAFTTHYINIFIILFFVALGLAFPFIMTGFFPHLISFLPKPGLWMDKLKKLLGLTLLLTFVWLYDVLAGLIDYSYAGIYLNTMLTLVFFAFYFRARISKIFAWNVFFFILPVIFIFFLIQIKAFEYKQVDNQHIQKSGSLIWSKWSEEEMKSLKGEFVFVDFTAKWCLTCKVNKKVVLETNGFEKLVEEYNIKLMVADWTKRDDHITDFLSKHGVVGVPAYFIQRPNGELLSLGEIISLEKIKKNLE